MAKGEKGCALRARQVIRPGAAAALLVSMVSLPLSQATAQFGNICQTNIGACASSPGPLGAACACFTPGGPIYGVILQGGYMAPTYASDICRTMRGICQVPAMPVGAPCGCYGDPGQIVPR